MNCTSGDDSRTIMAHVPPYIQQCVTPRYFTLQFLLPFHRLCSSGGTSREQHPGALGRVDLSSYLQDETAAGSQAQVRVVLDVETSRIAREWISL